MDPKFDGYDDIVSAASGVDGRPALDVCLFQDTGPGAFEKAAQKCLNLVAEQQSDTDRIEIIIRFMEEAAAAFAVDGKGEDAVLATSDEACAAVALQTLQDAPSQWHDGLEKVLKKYSCSNMQVLLMQCLRQGV